MGKDRSLNRTQPNVGPWLQSFIYVLVHSTIISLLGSLPGFGERKLTFGEDTVNKC